MNVAAVIVAAGSGTRAGGGKPKQYQLIGGKPVLRWTLEAFSAHPAITHILTVIGQGHEMDFAEATEGLQVSAPVLGGATRQQSCRIGIDACAAFQPDLILIHDAARPFVSERLISSVIDRLRNTEAVIPILPVTDTVKQIHHDVIRKTLDRSTLCVVQTPQGFHFDRIRAAHTDAEITGRALLTDDASVAEAFGIQVHAVPGDFANRKLTTQYDIEDADAELTRKLFANLPDIRLGNGLDFHVFAAGKSVWLCGIEIPHTHKLKGHSDADVAMHALTDAILGAIGEGDIGTHFPPSDPQWKNAKSSIFLTRARDLLAAKGGLIANVDVTILAEAPKISPHIPAMKAELGRILDLAQDRIAIKATTTEKMGAIGRKEGMAAHGNCNREIAAVIEPHELVAKLLTRKTIVATAESCTGGMVAAAITDIAGSSAVFDRGFVTYSNEAKSQMLGVPAAMIAKFGAVSEEVARAMAEGALAHSNATLAVAITGIAGPTGGSADKPVGLVHLACAVKKGTIQHERKVFPGDRAAIRLAARDFALQMLGNALSG